MSFKRNQLEEAIARVFGLASKKRASELRMRIKRLLALDRALGRKPRSNDAEQATYAFFSEEPPGTGADILFSEYEAFALLTAVRMLENGWPQGYTLSLLRRGRAELQRVHGRLLREPPEQVLAEPRMPPDARSGDPVPIYGPVLAIFSKSDRAADEPKGLPKLCNGYREAAELHRELGTSSMTLFQLAVPAHLLHRELSKTQPRRRGRA